MPLKVAISSRASATVLPLTAADIMEADDWLIEHPVPPILMSAAVKGKTVAEARELIATFKGMMSIHEATLPAGAAGADDGTGSDERSPEPAEPEAVDVDALGELAALQGVVKFPVRIKCATLSWNTLAQGLDEATAPA